MRDHSASFTLPNTLLGAPTRSLMAPLTRRTLLQMTAGGLAGAAGCTGPTLPSPVDGVTVPDPFTNDAYAASYARGEPWPVEGHDAGRTSHTGAPVPLGDVDAAWLRRPGSDPHGATAPVVGPDRIYVAYAATLDDADAVHAGLAGYTVREGTEAFDVRLGRGEPAGAALAADNLVVVRRNGDRDGAIVDGRSLVDGSAEWSITLPDVTGPPATRDDTVFLATRKGDDALYAFDAGGGRRWRTAIDGSCYTAPCADGKSVYVGLEDGRVAAVAAEDGEPRWTAPVADPDDCCPDIQGTPTVADGRLFVPGIREELVAVDVTDGSVAWRTQVVDQDYGNPVPSPAVDEDTAYVNTHHGGLVALALDDGHVRWRVDEPGSFLPPAVGADGFVVPRGDAVVGYDAGHREAWAVGLTVPDAGMAAYIMEPRVALAHGLAFVTLHDGRVYAIGARG